MEPIRNHSGLPVADAAGSDDAPIVVDVDVTKFSAEPRNLALCRSLQHR